MNKKEVGKTFPNLKRNIAYYCSISQFITLHEINECELPDLLKDKRDMNEVTKASIYIHEIRHNLDHLATLWGQKNLLKLSDALQARISNKESEFHKILPLKREENQFHYNEYYTVHYNEAVYGGPQDAWIWQLSSGVKFDTSGVPNENEPIPFIKFSKQSGVPLVRLPLSIAALLETNSTFDEYKHVIDHINSLPKLERAVENKLLNSSFLKSTLYNQYMAVYNSVVHLTANILKLTDVISALAISSSLATVTLNLPSGLIKDIPIPDIARKHWKKRNEAMLNNTEYGYIFYIMLSNYEMKFKEHNRYDLESLLEANNLPPSKELLDYVFAELEYIKTKFRENRCLSSYFDNTSEKGTEILKLRGLDGKRISTEQIIKAQLFTPDLICADTDFDLVKFDLAAVTKSPPENLSVEERYSFLDFMNSKLDEFFAIRGL